MITNCTNNNICIICQDDSSNIQNFKFKCDCWCGICDSIDCKLSIENIKCIYNCTKSTKLETSIYNPSEIVEFNTNSDFFDEAPIYEKLLQIFLYKTMARQVIDFFIYTCNFLFLLIPACFICLLYMFGIMMISTLLYQIMSTGLY